MTENTKHSYTLEQPNRNPTVEGRPDVQSLALAWLSAGAERSEPETAGAKADIAIKVNGPKWFSCISLSLRLWLLAMH